MRAVAGTLVCALALAACSQSQVAPDADVAIAGRVLGSDGAPLSEAAVGLHVDPGPSILWWAPAIVATFGVVCATDVCGADHETRTDRDGRFRFDLTGRQVSGSFGEEVDLLVSVSGPASLDHRSGPSAQARFVVREETTELPQLTLWDPEVTVSAGGVAWDRPPGSEVGGYEVLFQTSAGAPAWRAPATAEGLGIDARILEDSAGGVAGVASLPPPGDGAVAGVELRTGTRRYRSLAGPPASRHARCTLVGDDGSRLPLAPCPLTDGDLTAPTVLQLPCRDDGPCPSPAAIELELGEPRPVELVVVRGCPRCTLEVGGAGAQLTEHDTAVALEATADVVRLRGELDDVREVSVWDGPARGGLEAVTVEPPPQTVGGHPPAAVPDAGRRAPVPAGRPTWPILLATLLLGAASGGLAVAGLRRR